MVVVEYANRLSERGHTVGVVIPAEAIAPELKAMLLPRVNLIQTRQTLPAKIGLLGKLRLTWQMARAIPPGDVILTTHTPTTLVTLIASKLMRKGLPIWFYMDYPGMFAQRRVEAWLLRHAMRWHRGAVVLSGHSAQELQAISGKRAVFVGLGMSHAEAFHPVPQSRAQPNAKTTLLYLGDFRPRKGLQDFLAAAELVYQKRPELELWLALKEPGEVQTPIPHRVFYRPDTSELAELYATCDVFVSASWFEGFGLPPLEAMACGAAVVMTDSGGVMDFARDGENCLLVRPKSPVQMAEAILKLLNDPALQQMLRGNGPSTAAEFTWDKATDRLETALLSFISP